MAATLSDFRAMFPEFDKVSDALVNVHLNAAILEIDENIWRAKANLGHLYLSAHMLACSPYGQHAKLVPATVARRADNAGLTTYAYHYQKLVRQVSSGFRVI